MNESMEKKSLNGTNLNERMSAQFSNNDINIDEKTRLNSIYFI